MKPNPYRCTSLASLQEIKDVSEEDAKFIRAVWRSRTLKELSRALGKDVSGTRADLFGELKRTKIALRLNAFDVEHLGNLGRNETEIHVCAVGDPYAPTVVFAGGDLRVACAADYTERGSLKKTPQLF